MTHPLIDRLRDEFGYPTITLANHDEFVGRPGMNVLFFPGDPETVRDATDVAVILPELDRAFDRRLHPGVVTDVFGDGKKLKHRYRFSRYPSLVFVRGGDHVGTLSRVKDWSDYLLQVRNFFAAPPRQVADANASVTTT